MPASLALTAELCGVLLPLQKGYLSIQNTSTLVGKRPPFRGLNVIFGISKSEKGLCHFHICIFFFKFFFNRSKCQYSDKKIQSHRGWLITASLHLLWVGFFFFCILSTIQSENNVSFIYSCLIKFQVNLDYSILIMKGILSVICIIQVIRSRS